MELREALLEELAKPLPGITSQLKMSPEHRSFQHRSAENIIEAAVSLVILNTGQKKPQMVLIKRPEYEGHHSGQVSFPGGKMDSSDFSLLDCAIRETREETGLALDVSENLGKLTPLDIPVSGFRVTPFVFFVNRSVEFLPDTGEVEYLICFPLKILLDESIIRLHRFRHEEFEFEAPYFPIKNEIVWGATSMILAEFADILRNADKKNPGLFRTGINP